MKAILLVCISFCCFSFLSAQVPFYSNDFVLQQPKFYKVPAVGGDTARFAYLQKSGNFQYVRLAELTTAYPEPMARKISTLAIFDSSDVYPGVTESVVDMSASPDNRYLLVYSLQEGYFATDGFFDHNMAFYDMVDGTSLGLKNEHSFSVINRSNAYSQVFEDFLLSLIDIGLPPEEASGFDFMVKTEGVLEGNPDWQWNADGTVTLQLDLDVHESYNGGVMGDFIGVDTFYQTFEITPTGLSSLGFGPPPAPALYPARFALGPQSGPPAKVVFMGKDVIFPLRLGFRFGKGKYYRTTKVALMVEGNIPKRYVWRYGYR